MPDSDTFWGDQDYVWAALPRSLAHLIGFNEPTRSEPWLHYNFASLSFLKAVVRSQNKSADSPNLRLPTP
jgi:hypothetical protein